MTGFAATISRFSDRVNPIAVKELRQAVRSRIVTGMLVFFLILQFVVVALYLLMQPSAASDLTSGRDLAAALYAILMFLCVVFVPMYSGIRLAWERSTAHCDLMFATTISAWAIIRGKMLTAALIVGLLYSACAPFMVFTYLLRGIDLPVIFMMLGTGLVYIMAAVQFALFLACIPASRLAKILLGLFSLGTILYLAGASLFLGVAMLTGSGFFFPAVSTGQFWVGAALGGASALAGIGTLYFLSVALIRPPSANRMLPVRIYVTVVWLLAGTVAAIWAIVGGVGEMILVWAVTSSVLLAGAMLLAVSERESWRPRVRRSIPRGIVARAVAFLFYSGSAGGVLWTSLMLGLTLLAVLLLEARGYLSTLNSIEILYICGGIALYALAYCLTGGLLRRLVRRLGWRIPHYYTWVLVMALATVGSVVPPLLLLIMAYDTGHWWNIAYATGPLAFLNPFYLGVSINRDSRILFVLVWAAVVAVASIPWFVGQVRGFRPLKPKAAPTTGAANHE